MGTTNGTMLNKIWRDVGALGDDVEVIKSDKMYTSELNGEKITLWKDEERTKQELLDLSPEDEAEINSLINYIKMSKHIEIPSEKPSELMNVIDLAKMGKSMKDALKIFKGFKGIDTVDLMNRFKHPLIRCLISDFCTKESMGHSFPMAYGNFTSGDGGIPRGGSLDMAFRMQKKFESLGGKVYTGCDVKKIELSDKNATGIVLSNGETIKADYIIPSCDPDYTFNHLLDESYMDPVLKEVYSNRKDYPVYGMFQVAFSVDSELKVIDGEVMLDAKDIGDYSWIGDRITIKDFSYEPSFAPKGKQIVQVLLGLSEESYDYWVEIYSDKEEYQSKKEEIANKILKKLEKRFVEYKGKMKILDIWTPITYKRYCNAYKGYNQAFTITKNSMKNPYPSAYVKGIDNVILAGQWLSPPGGLPGAAIQGKFSIQRILKKEKRSINI